MNQLDLVGSYQRGFGNALAGGQQMQQMTAQREEMQRQEEMRNWLSDNAGALMQGDQQAMAGYAQYDPESAFTMQRQVQADNRASQMHGLNVENIRQQMALRTAEEARKLTAAEREAEASQAAAALSSATAAFEQGPEAMAAWTQQNADMLAEAGIDPAAVTVETFPMIVAGVQGAVEGLSAGMETARSFGPEEPDLTATQREYQMARDQGFEGSLLDYRTALAEAGRDQNTISVGAEETAFGKETGKIMAQEAADVVAQGAQAQRSMGQINTLEQALQNAPSGAGGALLNAAANLGIKTEGSSNVEVANAIISQLVPAQRPPGSGVMSDADLEMFRQSLPRLINTREGNKRIIDTMRGIAEYDMQRGQIARQLQLGEITPQQASQAYQALGNPLSGIQDDMPSGGSGGDQPADDLTPEERRFLGLD